MTFHTDMTEESVPGAPDHDLQKETQEQKGRHVHLHTPSPQQNGGQTESSGVPMRRFALPDGEFGTYPIFWAGSPRKASVEPVFLLLGACSWFETLLRLCLAWMGLLIQSLDAKLSAYPVLPWRRMRRK